MGRGSSLDFLWIRLSHIGAFDFAQGLADQGGLIEQWMAIVGRCIGRNINYPFPSGLPHGTTMIKMPNKVMHRTPNGGATDASEVKGSLRRA
jgi:hypothetical protein